MILNIRLGRGVAAAVHVVGAGDGGEGVHVRPVDRAGRVHVRPAGVDADGVLGHGPVLGRVLALVSLLWERASELHVSSDVAYMAGRPYILI